MIENTIITKNAGCNESLARFRSEGLSRLSYPENKYIPNAKNSSIMFKVNTKDTRTTSMTSFLCL